MTTRAFPSLAPTRNIAGFLFIVAVMWYAAASQGNGAAYLLLFLLLGVMLVSIPRTLTNLTSLKVTADFPRPAFAGQEVSLPVEVGNLSRRARHTISLGIEEGGHGSAVLDEIPAGQAAREVISFTAGRRGEHEIPPLVLTSAYPLGFLAARQSVPVHQRYLVYPKPGGDPRLPHTQGRRQRKPSEGLPAEGDDFAGVRTYIDGESQRHIDWKAVARGQPMMTKQFATEGDGALQFDFAAVPVKSIEERLSQLTLWVIEAERARRRYSLRLPSLEIAASLGEAHYHKCLRALALHR
jgi:uncharacterized protein (DUF58 family)